MHSPGIWPLVDVAGDHVARAVSNLGARFGPLPTDACNAEYVERFDPSDRVEIAFHSNANILRAPTKLVSGSFTCSLAQSDLPTSVLQTQIKVAATACIDERDRKIIRTGTGA